MAYAALVSLQQTLEQVTNGDRRQTKVLHEKLSFLLSFLEDYAHNSKRKVDQLEGRIREAAYQAADVIELYVWNEVSLQYKLGFHYLHRRKRKSTCYEDLQKSIQEIDAIVEEALEIRKISKTNKDLIPSRSLSAGSSRRAPSFQTTVVGLEDDLMKLKERLCVESPNLQILSIVGMGGIGKTTLARAIFNDSFVAYHFDFRLWVTISQEYSMRDILLVLLHSLDTTIPNLSDERLAEHVYKILKGRRYLIIMDDMWSTEAWDDVRRILPDDNNGSRILITTRLSEVAIYADSSNPPHQVNLLNKDQSWSLLQEKVFAHEHCPVELEKLGKIIAGKCGGLPLAIVLVAGLLSKVGTTLHLWKKFELNVSTILETGDDYLFKIFSLSYNNLPHHLRACFLYMGGFPEDSQISISKLSKLWTAEGFLKPVSSKSSEEVAEEYVEDLANTNLISITRKRFNDKSRICTVHDLLREFCTWKATEENFLHVESDGRTLQEEVGNERRLCIFVEHTVPAKENGWRLRSVLFDKYARYSMPYATSYRLLRILDGAKIHLQLFPTEVTGLFQLRYLAFSYFSQFTTPFVIPTSISKLQNLETLVITSDYRKFPRLYELGRKIHLPSEIWKIPKLRHLILHNYCHLPVPFHWFSVGKPSILQNLQTLSRVTNFSFTKEAIEMIPNLKKLKVIYYREVVKPKMVWSTCHLNNLPLLHQLESLNLFFPFKSLSDHSLRANFIQNFALPLKLKKLTLTGCSLSWQDLSIVGRLPNLEILQLRDESVVGNEWISTEGEFLQLKFLLLEGLYIECWRADYTHFPNLEHLIVRNCWQLQEIPSDIGEIPALQSIELVNVAESARKSAIQIQEEQESMGNDLLRVYVSYRRVI